MLALFAILGVSITFTCVDKLGVVSKGSNRFSEVSRILLDEDICMSGIISVIDMSVVSLFKKIKSLLLLILFVIFLDWCNLFTLSLKESLVICWKSMVHIMSSNICLVSACWCWFFFFLITCKIVLPTLINSTRYLQFWREAWTGNYLQQTISFPEFNAK